MSPSYTFLLIGVTETYPKGILQLQAVEKLSHRTSIRLDPRPPTDVGRVRRQRVVCGAANEFDVKMSKPVLGQLVGLAPMPHWALVQALLRL